MAALDNIYSGFGINKNFNGSYTGPIFRIWSRDSGSDVFLDVEQDGNGEPDLTALQNEASWNASHDWAYYAAFSPWGNHDWLMLPNNDRTNFSWSDGRWNKFWDQTSQTFSTDANGKLIIPSVVEGKNEFVSCSIPASLGAATISNVPLSQYSSFVRHKIKLFDPASGEADGLVLTQDTVDGRAPQLRESSDGPLTFQMGSPTYYKDGVLLNPATRPELWTEYVIEPVYVAGVVNYDLTIDRTVAEPLYVFGGRPNSWGFEQMTSILMYSGDVGAQASDIQTLLDNTYSTTLTPKVTFLDGAGSPIVGGHVLWIEEAAFAADSASWNSPVIVESTGTTDANGEVTYSGTVDPAKVYTAVLRDYDYVSGSWVKSQGSDTGQQNVDLTAPA